MVKIMKHQLKIFLTLSCLFSACQTTSTFDQLDINTIDLTRITGEYPDTQSFFDSALWSAVLSAAILAALSSNETSYKTNKVSATEMDSEWIE